MMNTMKCFERLRSRSVCRDCEWGSLSVELAIAVPIIGLITLFVVQGFLAASVVQGVGKVGLGGVLGE